MHYGYDAIRSPNLKLKLTVDGKVYEVEVEVSQPEQPHPSYVPPAAGLTSSSAATRPAQPAPSNDDAVTDEGKVCRSPISGVVVRVSAKVGQDIQANDELMVLEAMKMETVITSPVAGKIIKINVNEGDSVQTKKVLAEFE